MNRWIFGLVCFFWLGTPNAAIRLRGSSLTGSAAGSGLGRDVANKHLVPGSVLTSLAEVLEIPQGGEEQGGEASGSESGEEQAENGAGEVDEGVQKNFARVLKQTLPGIKLALVHLSDLIGGSLPPCLPRLLFL